MHTETRISSVFLPMEPHAKQEKNIIQPIYQNPEQPKFCSHLELFFYLNIFYSAIHIKDSDRLYFNKQNFKYSPLCERKSTKIKWIHQLITCLNKSQTIVEPCFHASPVVNSGPDSPFHTWRRDEGSSPQRLPTGAPWTSPSRRKPQCSDQAPGN